MVIAVGAEQYDVGCQPVSARGLSYTTEDLESALSGPVAEIMMDEVGLKQVEDLLVGVAETEFQSDRVRAMLAQDRVPEDWRVGEALAEVYLTCHRDCEFPWPTSRDQKDPNSSMPGTDLVGFQRTESAANSHRFAFGEVKTSDQELWPPSVMYGRHGLKQQLEDLRNLEKVRGALVLYLAHHAVNASWQGKFREATSRFLADSTDVSLFGIMIRDVEPKATDLQARAKSLAKDCPTMMGIELLAIYLPRKVIHGIGQRVHSGGVSCHGGD